MLLRGQNAITGIADGGQDLPSTLPFGVARVNRESFWVFLVVNNLMRRLLLCAGNSADAPAPMTPEAVEKALDEVRPYLIADGGNVEVRHRFRLICSTGYVVSSGGAIV